jgi:Spy/CpxP family protein refolding chaperone
MKYWRKLMKQCLCAIVVLTSLLGWAQTNPPARQEPRPTPHAGHDMAMGMPGMDWMASNAGLFSEWWKNPEIASELHLTDAQKSQLDQASLSMKLAGIDALANAGKSLVSLQAQLESDQFSESVYGQQVDQLSSAASRLIKDVGQGVLTMRKTLTPEQWHKLQAWQHSRRPGMTRAPGEPRSPRQQPPM